jgi:hypothetical protein
MQVTELKPVKQIRKPITPSKWSAPPTIITPGATKLLDNATYNHRTKVIATLWKNCQYKTIGQLVRPASDEAFQKEGLYRIVSVCATWQQYRGSANNELEVPWPANDNPMLVVAINLKNNKNIEATTNYFIPYVDQSE